MMVQKTELDLKIEAQEKEMKEYELQHKFDEGVEAGRLEGISTVMVFMDLMIGSSEKWDQERKDAKLSRRVGNLPTKIRAQREIYGKILNHLIDNHGYVEKRPDYVKELLSQPGILKVKPSEDTQ